MSYISPKLTKIFGYFKGLERQIVVLILLILVSTAIQILIPYATSTLIDQFVAVKNIDGMSQYLIGLIVIFIILSIVSYTSTTIVGNVAQNVLFKLRNELFAKIQSLPTQFFIANNSGEIISRLNNDTRKLDNFLSRYIFEFIVSFFSFVGLGVFIFFQSWQLALASWFMIIILIVLSQLIGPSVANASKDQLQSNAEITTFLNENITNYKAIVAFNQQQGINEHYSKLVKNNFKLSFKSKILTGVFRPIYNFAGLITQAIVLGLGIYLISQGQATSGVLIGFIFYVNRFYDPINRLAAIYASYQQAKGAWNRIDEILSLDSRSPNLTLTTSKAHLEREFDE
jgi:ATP-binding cassette, subfamily B, bacterial